MEKNNKLKSGNQMEINKRRQIKKKHKNQSNRVEKKSWNFPSNHGNFLWTIQIEFNYNSIELKYCVPFL